MNNKLIIITAPSGAGKTSITKYLLAKYTQLAFSISAATRHARDGETNGVDYYFISVNEFKKNITDNNFIEWEMVYDGKYYGTLIISRINLKHFTYCKPCINVISNSQFSFGE